MKHSERPRCKVGRHTHKNDSKRASAQNVYFSPIMYSALLYHDALFGFEASAQVRRHCASRTRKKENRKACKREPQNRQHSLLFHNKDIIIHTNTDHHAPNRQHKCPKAILSAWASMNEFCRAISNHLITSRRA